MKSKAEDKVNVLQDILKKPKEAVLNEAQDRYKKLSVQLEDFLRTKDIIQDCVKSVIAKITTPELDSFQEIQNRCKKLCYEYINSKISNWLRDNKPENTCDDLKGQTLQSLHEFKFQSSFSDAQVAVNEPSQDDMRKAENEHFSKKEKLGLTMTFPLWFPVALTAGVIVAPIGLVAKAAEKMRDKNAVKNFYLHLEENVTQILDGILKEERYSNDFFFAHFEKYYLHLFVQWIDENEETKRKCLEFKLLHIKALEKDIPLTDEEKTKFVLCKETMGRINNKYNLSKIVHI